MLARLRVGLIVLGSALAGCNSSGSAPARDAGSRDEPSRAAASAPAAVTPASSTPWVAEAPDFDPFFQGIAPICTRRIVLDRDREGWMKGYDMTLPGAAPEAVEAHFRTRARELGFAVTQTSASSLMAGDKLRRTAASLTSSSFLFVTVPLPNAQLEAELRRTVTGAPAEVFVLIQDIGGTAALSRMQSTEGPDVGRDISIELVRDPEITDGVIATAAKKAGLVSEGADVFHTKAEPRPGAWHIGVVIDEASIRIIVANPASSRSPACSDHPARATAESSAPDRPQSREEQDKANEELFRTMMGE